MAGDPPARATGEYLGKVQAANEEAALNVAIKAFDLTAIEQAKAIVDQAVR